jgi:hypothetical protein
MQVRNVLPATLQGPQRFQFRICSSDIDALLSGAPLAAGPSSRRVAAAAAGWQRAPPCRLLLQARRPDREDYEDSDYAVFDDEEDWEQMVGG